MAKKARRAPRAVMKSRISQVEQLLLGGRTRAQILRHAAEKWQLSERQTDEYIKQATAEIEEANASSAERHLALITTNLWGFFRTHRKKDPGFAKQALLDIAKLRGLENNEMTLHVRKHKDATDDEIAAAIGGAA